MYKQYSPQSLHWYVHVCGLALVLVCAGLNASTQQGGFVLVADVKGPIGPATSELVKDAVASAIDGNAALVVLRMDTPGGLSESMREIIKTVLTSSVPVATFVSPSGSRAASAGTYILYASHIAAMAPGTNLGAATPVSIGDGLPLPNRSPPQHDGQEPKANGSEPSSDSQPPSGGASERKMLNDAVAYIRSLAELRGRNADWAVRAVRSAESLPANQALELNVIDVIANDIDQLLDRINGLTVTVQGKPTTLDTTQLSVRTFEPSWQIQLLAILTNPNVAFILMIIGIYGLVFEFSNPGSVGPGVIGVVCLLLGLYSLNLLPLDYTGLALLLLGIAFMVAEVFTPTFGVLGIGGLVAFVLGASLLLDSDSPHFRLSIEVIAGTAIASGVVLALVLGFALSSQRRAVTTGNAELIAQTASVIEWTGQEGYVRVRGERWRARCQGPLSPGDNVVVNAVDGLVLEVAPDRIVAQGETS